MRLISKKTTSLVLSCLVVLGFPLAANSQTVKISQLPLQPAASTNPSDSVPFANIGNNTTWRLQLGDIQNLPGLVGKYAPLITPTFTGPVTVNGVTISTGGFSGNLTGNASTATALAANPADCASGQYANSIAANGDLTCSSVQTSEITGSINLATQVSGVLPVANGGTGEASASEAFDNLAPTTTNGDLIIRGSSANKRLPVGDDGYVLISDSAVADGGMRWGPSPGTPPGMVGAFALTSCPSGWVEGDGSEVSRSGANADLFAAMGTIHGTGNGTTTFNLPNYRGRFLRGRANGTALDPDRASRTAMATGGATGDNVGSVQGHAFQTHTHTQNSHTHTAGVQGGYGSGAALSPVNGTGGYSGANTYQIQNSSTTATNNNAAASGATAQASTNETRPVNAYVIYCVKL